MVRGYWIFDGAWDRRNSGLMEDTLYLTACLCHGRRIVDIRLNEIHRLQPAQIFSLAGSKVVNTSYSFATPE